MPAPAARVLPPLNIQAWIEDHRHQLKPGAVGAGTRCLWEDRDLIVAAVAGPENRKDYHVNPTDELFFQVEGDIIVRVMEEGSEPVDVPVRQGEMLLIPAGTPHAPQRASGTIGLLIERRRPKGEDDLVRFYCDKCTRIVHEEQYDHSTGHAQLRAMTESFWSDATLRTCVHCGYVLQRPSGTVLPPPKDLVYRAPAASRAGKPASRAKVTTKDSSKALTKTVVRSGLMPATGRKRPEDRAAATAVVAASSIPSPGTKAGSPLAMARRKMTTGTSKR